MKVKNLNRAAQRSTNGSWLERWEKLSGQTAYWCFVKGCTHKHSAGGLVQKDSLTDKNWYIVPLCDDCNKKWGQNLDIWDVATLVPANAVKITRLVPTTPPIRAPRAAGSFS